MNALEKRFVAKLKLEREQAKRKAEGLDTALFRVRKERDAYVQAYRNLAHRHYDTVASLTKVPR